MTIAVVPTLVKKNIAAVSVGVNDGTSAPAVPKIFTWKFDSDNEVIAMWHKGTAIGTGICSKYRGSVMSCLLRSIVL